MTRTTSTSTGWIPRSTSSCWTSNRNAQFKTCVNRYARMALLDNIVVKCISQWVPLGGRHWKKVRNHRDQQRRLVALPAERRRRSFWLQPNGWSVANTLRGEQGVGNLPLLLPFPHEDFAFFKALLSRFIRNLLASHSCNKKLFPYRAP